MLNDDNDYIKIKNWLKYGILINIFLGNNFGNIGL